MLKKTLLITVIAFLLVFGANRIDFSQSALTSNYLVIKDVERQNLEEVIRAVKFHLPSFNIQAQHFSASPYVNNEGEVVVYIGNRVDNGVLLDLPSTPDNNFLYDFLINYSSTNQEVHVVDNLDGAEHIHSLPLTTPDGEKVKVIRCE